MVRKFRCVQMFLKNSYYLPGIIECYSTCDDHDGLRGWTGNIRAISKKIQRGEHKRINKTRQKPQKERKDNPPPARAKR